MKALKYIRIAIAVVSVLALTFLFVDATGWAPAHLDFMARIQLVPALLALNFVAIAILLVLTLVFGRLYCSVICPLGIFQDVLAWARKVFAGKRKRKVGVYKYHKAHSKARIIVLACFVAVILLGALNLMAVSLGAIIEPYSAFGRMVTAFVSPVYDTYYNNMAEASAAAGEYEYDFIQRSVPLVLMIIAGVTFLVVGFCAVKAGRAYCNTICPVGTVLGYLSKFSWLKPRIDLDKCNRCGSCQRHCKAQCIDSKNHVIEYTHCVDCFDCINVCNQNAISYRPAKPSDKTPEPTATDKGRRKFVASLGILTGAVVAKAAEGVTDKVTDGGLTPLKQRKPTVRKVRIVPPGAISQAHINAHCVGCQLCIQACPNGLLTMSTDLETLMQPVLTYTPGYCPTECTQCSNVCPAGVFKPLDEVMKSSWKVGTAVVDFAACLSANGTDYCGNCARHCPVGAIQMVEDENGDAMPIVNENICIGCGACEAHCPVGTVASMEADQPAIHVEGVAPQRFI